MRKIAFSFLASFFLVLSVNTVGSQALPTSDKYSPSQAFADRCGPEKSLRGKALEIQKYLLLKNYCVTAMRVPESKISSGVPKIALSGDGSTSAIELCKPQQQNPVYGYRGFPSSNDTHYLKKRHPGAGSVIQVLGVSAPDARAGKNSPSQDYKYYLDFLKKWVSSIDNSGKQFKIRVEDKWYNLEEKLAPLNLKHENFGERHKRFGAKVVALADADVDFSDVGYVLVVVPAGTPSEVVWQAGLGWPNTAEGQIFNMSLSPPATFNPKIFPRSANDLAPLMWIHELYHPGFDMGDQYGDGNSKYKTSAMGAWGMFATGTTDMLQWQKWLLGFTTDSQVICANPNLTTANWLVPGSTKSSRDKLLVVPLSPTKVIVVESVRATGVNYKLTKPEQGALVYTVDVNDPRKDFGYEVQIPTHRIAKTWQAQDRPINGVRRFPLDTAPLKVGEFVTVDNIKITNVEWGAFGDVIKVEKTK